jgi:hypothetical protein
MKKSVEWLVTGGVVAFLLWLLCYGAAWAVKFYESSKSSQPVTHDTPVWIQGDWLVGEYRVCQMRTKMQPEDPDSLAKLPRLFCAQDASGFVDFQLETDSVRQKAPIPTGDVTANVFDVYFHVLPVSYSGFIKTSSGDYNFPLTYDFIYDYDRTDKLVISWRCQRNSDSLTCKALD